jgi:hypothetical protein
MAVVEDLSANGTAVNGVIVGRNNLLELRDNDEVRVADEAHFLFRYSTHDTPRFEQHYIMRDAVGKVISQVFAHVLKELLRLYTL